MIPGRLGRRVYRIGIRSYAGIYGTSRSSSLLKATVRHTNVLYRPECIGSIVRHFTELAVSREPAIDLPALVKGLAENDPSAEKTFNSLISTITTDPVALSSTIESLADPSLRALHDRIYTAVMCYLIVKESPDLIEMHRKLTGSQPQLSSKTWTLLFELGCLRSHEYQAYMTALLDELTVSRTFLDLLLEYWSQVEVPARSLLPVICKSIEMGLFPRKPESYAHLQRILETAASTADFETLIFLRAIETYLTLHGPAEMPLPLLKIAVRLCTTLRNRDPFATFLKLYESCRRHVGTTRAHKPATKVIHNGSLWETVILSIRTTPVDGILEFMKQNGIKPTRRAERAILMRQDSASVYHEGLTDYIKGGHVSREDFIFLNGQLLRLVSKEDPESVAQLYTALNESRKKRYPRENTMKDRPEWIEALMYGHVESRAWPLVFDVFDGTKARSPRIWNLYASALARSGNVVDAWQTVRRMNGLGIAISQETVVSLVFEMLRSGRQEEAMMPDGQSTRVPIRVICQRIALLAEWGAQFPVNYNANLFQQLRSISIRYQDINLLAIKLASLYAKGLSLSDTAQVADGKDVMNLIAGIDVRDAESHSTLKQLLLGDARARVTADAQVFSDEAIEQLVFLGFCKNPRQPWVPIAMLKKINDMGLHIPSSPVIDTLQRTIGHVYGESPQGEYKRIKDQANPDLTPQMIVEYCNLAWEGKLKQSRRERERNELPKLPSAVLTAAAL